MRSTTATSGAISEKQIGVLKKVVKGQPWLGGIDLAFDNDSAGRKMAQRIEKELREVSGTQICQALPFIHGYDWNEMLTKGPIGYIREAQRFSRVFGKLSEDKDGRLLHGRKDDAIFLFQRHQDSMVDAIRQAKRLGWTRISIYGHSKSSAKLEQLARQQGLDVVIEKLPSQHLQMEIDVSAAGT